MDIYFNNPDLRRSVTSMGASGARAEDAFLGGATGYDPQAAVRASAMGAFNQFRKQFGKDLTNLRGSQVGMGRLDTGFATQDENELMVESMDRLQDKLLSNTMNAEGLRLQNQGQLASYAQFGRGQELEALAGLSATQNAQRLQDKASKRSMWGTLGGMALGAAGTALLGPAGGALGSWAGRKLGNR